MTHLHMEIDALRKVAECRDDTTPWLELYAEKLFIEYKDGHPVCLLSMDGDTTHWKTYDGRCYHTGQIEEAIAGGNVRCIRAYIGEKMIFWCGDPR